MLQSCFLSDIKYVEGLNMWQTSNPSLALEEMDVFKINSDDDDDDYRDIC